MIAGIVNPNREAAVCLKVQETNGREQEVEAVIDTGFTGQFTLSPAHITGLGLAWLTPGQAIMANGEIETFDVDAAVILWNGLPIRVMVEEANTEPLIGMSLLHGYKMAMKLVDGGPAIIERI